MFIIFILSSLSWGVGKSRVADLFPPFHKPCKGGKGSATW